MFAELIGSIHEFRISLLYSTFRFVLFTSRKCSMDEHIEVMVDNAIKYLTLAQISKRYVGKHSRFEEGRDYRYASDMIIST